MSNEPQILLISGSVRTGSSNQALLATAAVAAPPGIATVSYDGIGGLPHFNPDDDHDPLPPSVDALRNSIASAHGLLFCTPEYAGALPGAFKNLLDWTVGGIEINEKPSGWINISTAPAGAAGAHAELANVLRYTGAHIIDAACRHIPVARTEIGADGVIAGPAIRHAIIEVLHALADDATP